MKKKKIFVGVFVFFVLMILAVFLMLNRNQDNWGEWYDVESHQYQDIGGYSISDGILTVGELSFTILDDYSLDKLDNQELEISTSDRQRDENDLFPTRGCEVGISIKSFSYDNNRLDIVKEQSSNINVAGFPGLRTDVPFGENYLVNIEVPVGDKLYSIISAINSSEKERCEEFLGSLIN